MPDKALSHAGEVTSEGSPTITPSHVKLVHCECGARARPHFDKGHLVAYICPEHGFLEHDQLIYVYHEFKDVPR